MKFSTWLEMKGLPQLAAPGDIPKRKPEAKLFDIDKWLQTVKNHLVEIKRGADVMGGEISDENVARLNMVNTILRKTQENIGMALPEPVESEPVEPKKEEPDEWIKFRQDIGRGLAL